jgi:hypothetical protein
VYYVYPKHGTLNLDEPIPNPTLRNNASPACFKPRAWVVPRRGVFSIAEARRGETDIRSDMETFVLFINQVKYRLQLALLPVGTNTKRHAHNFTGFVVRHPPRGVIGP